ncbi:MAG: PKD domain-containing protein [Chloroflexota bacterium]
MIPSASRLKTASIMSSFVARTLVRKVTAPNPEPDHAGFRDRMAAIVQSAPAGEIRESKYVFLDATTPPWVDTGLDLPAGAVVTTIALGRVYLNKPLDIYATPEYALWARVGEDTPIFSGTRDTNTFAAESTGRLYLATLSGEWSSNAAAYHWEVVEAVGPAIVLSEPDTATPNFTAFDDGVYTFRLTVRNGVGATASDEVVVTVNNVAPTLGVITAPSGPLAVNTAVAISAAFSDPGLLDTHTAEIDWGDGSVSAGVVNETDGSGAISGSHTYTMPGVYTVKVTVSDDDGGSGTAEYQYVVVYDPNGGFVTGGGWINSPQGAYAADPTLTGKATFGFVAKYQKGANVPTGNTEFQFKAGNLNFKSATYQWLVVAGAKAQFKGAGTINGAGDYGFMLTAIDGQIKGGGGVDKFRIKIWDKTTGDIVYDNLMGAADTADPTTAIDGGSIVIHK